MPDYLRSLCCSMLQHIAACCIVSQHGAACCSVLQHVAACCSVLLCLAACGSVVQCVTVPINNNVYQFVLKDDAISAHLAQSAFYPNLNYSNVGLFYERIVSK